MVSDLKAALKSLSLNLKSEEGLEIFGKLAERADVIIENSKPGTMEI